MRSKKILTLLPSVLSTIVTDAVPDDEEDVSSLDAVLVSSVEEDAVLAGVFALHPAKAQTVVRHSNADKILILFMIFLLSYPVFISQQ